MTASLQLPAARFVVCESSGLWAAALRRTSAFARLRVWETRSLDECWELVADAPASFLAIECRSAGVARTWQFLLRLSRVRPHARAAILGGPELAPWRWRLHEAGAIAVLVSESQTRRIGPAVARHLAMYPSRDRSLRQQLWDRLPWPESASAEAPS